MKEGGTSLHKTFRGINLAFKGLMVGKGLNSEVVLSLSIFVHLACMGCK